MPEKHLQFSPAIYHNSNLSKSRPNELSDRSPAALLGIIIKLIFV
ncbi:hypothetical protein L1276_003712 [Flavobacterium sp. HSC-32F16]|nr:hypothetical protein [Flavobacterium sp. HSC-32F16]MCP2028542.1 hypothetical protein [Flavobacterium sp. HSC-32F16]